MILIVLQIVEQSIYKLKVQYIKHKICQRRQEQNCVTLHTEAERHGLKAYERQSRMPRNIRATDYDKSCLQNRQQDKVPALSYLDLSLAAVARASERTVSAAVSDELVLNDRVVEKDEDREDPRPRPSVVR
ncbi:hypothetical protein ACJJTC_001053 [Scirpophaga incertulas]